MKEDKSFGVNEIMKTDEVIRIPLILILDNDVHDESGGGWIFLLHLLLDVPGDGEAAAALLDSRSE